MASFSQALSQALERAVIRVEQARGLDRIGEPARQVTDVLGPGRVKDLLSGTALGHPAHPLLVTVPIGAFASAIALDATGGDAKASRRLVGLGLLASLPVAVTGLSDWADTEGAERRVGVAHAVSNSAALVLLSGSWLSRRAGGSGRTLALAGFAVLGVGGWLGGHLAYALGVGVDTTAFSLAPQEWTDVCAQSDLEPGKPLGVRLADLSVLVVRDQGTIRALVDRCTHRGAPLHEGAVIDGCIQCPWHASRFRLDDGSVAQGPATRPQPALQCRVVDGRVQVRRPEARALRTNPVT